MKLSETFKQKIKGHPESAKDNFELNNMKSFTQKKVKKVRKLVRTKSKFKKGPSSPEELNIKEKSSFQKKIGGAIKRDTSNVSSLAPLA